MSGEKKQVSGGRRQQKAEGRRQKAEGRKQKAESRRQKAESRRQKAGGITHHSRCVLADETYSDHRYVRALGGKLCG